MWATQVVAAGALAGTFVLASCGNSGSGATVDEPVSTSGPGPAAGGGEADPVRPCVVFTLEEVEAMLGNPITAGPDPHGGTSGCEWTAEVLGEGGARESHVVDLQVHDVASALEDVLTLDGQPTTVEGLGDQALVETSASGFPAVMVGYRDAEHVVTLRYQVEGVGTSTVDPRDDPNRVVEVLQMLEGKIAQPAG